MTTSFSDGLTYSIKVIKAQRRGETKDFRAYLEFSDGLFTKGAIYISDSKSWFAQTDNFTLAI